MIGLIFLLIFVYGLFSEKLSNMSISGPMVFTVFGLIAGNYIEVEQLQINGEGLIVVGQIALIAILFTDASGIELKDFFKVYKLPIRLLFIGLPITMAIGTLVAIPLFPGFEIAALALMAFILSPTDAALGQAVVQSPKVPAKVRESINVESGLNDGLVLPPLLICVVILQGGGDQIGFSELAEFVGMQLFVAVLIGVILGWLGTRLINWSTARNYSDKFYQGICVVALAIITFVIAEHFGGNGFIATFIAGMVYSPKSSKVADTGAEFGEVISQPLALFIFFIFGAVLFPHFVEFIDLSVIIYSILSLTVLRMIPVVLSLRSTVFTMAEKVFIAWFGPRGIASILYILIVVDDLGGTEGLEKLYAVIVLTVMLSIFAHGLSAVPYANWLGKKQQQGVPEAMG